MTTPACRKAAAYVEGMLADSGPPKELVTIVAPRATALFSATPRLVKLASSASTRMILHFAHMPRTASTSRLISPAQPASAVGSGVVAPCWLTTRNVEVVSAGKPYLASKVFRSARTLGSSWASTMATTWVVAVVRETAYAPASAAGV